MVGVGGQVALFILNFEDDSGQVRVLLDRNRQRLVVDIPVDGFRAGRSRESAIIGEEVVTLVPDVGVEDGWNVDRFEGRDLVGREVAPDFLFVVNVNPRFKNGLEGGIIRSRGRVELGTDNGIAPSTRAVRLISIKLVDNVHLSTESDVVDGVLGAHVNVKLKSVKLSIDLGHRHIGQGATFGRIISLDAVQSLNVLQLIRSAVSALFTSVEKGSATCEHQSIGSRIIDSETKDRLTLKS